MVFVHQWCRKRVALWKGEEDQEECKGLQQPVAAAVVTLAL